MSSDSPNTTPKTRLHPLLKLAIDQYIGENQKNGNLEN